jgi:hypothetical protein
MRTELAGERGRNIKGRLRSPFFIVGTKAPFFTVSISSATTAPTAVVEVSFLHWPCLVDREVAPADFFSIELRDCFLRSAVVGHFDKGETFRASSIAIGDDSNRFNFANLAEHVTKVRFGGLKREISNVEFFCHSNSIRVPREAEADHLNRDRFSTWLLSVSTFAKQRSGAARADSVVI